MYNYLNINYLVLEEFYKKIKILYEDNHLLVVNKPSGILSQGDITGDNDITSIMKQYIKLKYEKPGKVFLTPAHRLDRPVSGSIILCRTSKALSRMTQIFRDRKIEKIYHAITLERPIPTNGRLVTYLKKDSKKNRSKASKKQFFGSKEAVLSYNLIGAISNSCLVEVSLKTGRPHQIRAQLAYAKMPILGDVKYYPQAPLEDKSIALHCRTLEFIHPVKKEPIRVTAAYPKRAWWSIF